MLLNKNQKLYQDQTQYILPATSSGTAPIQLRTRFGKRYLFSEAGTVLRRIFPSSAED